MRLASPVLALGVLALLGPLVPAPAATAAAPAPRRIVLTQWADADAFASGRARGVVAEDGELRFDEPAGVSGRYDYARWTSPWVEPGFDLTELVPSWHARTPGGSWVRLEVRGRGPAGRASWDTIASWARDDDEFTRTSPDSQADDLARVAYDTWLTGGLSRWQLRVTLLRPTGSSARPRVDEVGAMVSRLPDAADVATSRPTDLVGTVLPVPSYSQMAHRGTFPQYDGGGEAWCSPTSTTMVLGYYDALPRPRSYAWVPQSHPDREVVQVARSTYDAGFGGTGNWPFNTAYAATRTDRAFVTRLHTLREAEMFIAAGIPLVASVAFGPGELDGSPLTSTGGHLLVVVGFTDSGDVVVNDPAAATRAGVRRVYDRGQFEDAWLARYRSGGSLRGSGGLVYVVSDADHPLPERGSRHNW